MCQGTEMSKLTGYPCNNEAFMRPNSAISSWRRGDLLDDFKMNMSLKLSSSTEQIFVEPYGWLISKWLHIKGSAVCVP